MLSVLAETLAFHMFVGVHLRCGNLMRPDFIRYAISSDRLQSWASSGSSGMSISHDAMHLNHQTNTTTEISTSDLDEVQILLACRAYLKYASSLI